ncbi:MAG: hypothetical protein RL379_646 [Bacillota bacterium]|jgi:hypothetical protein
MKPSKAPIPIIILSLFLVSLISLYLGYLLKPLPVEIFRLSFDPVNVETNANINQDEETITFQELNETLIISNLNQGLFQMSLTFSGGTIMDEVDLGLPSLVMLINQKPISINITALIQTYQHGWVQLTPGNLTIQFQNFVKIEEQMYSLILSDITIWQH